MSYFRKISDYQTYSGHDSDVHYDYNANSGNGQAFLGGKFVDASGDPHVLKEYDGQMAAIVLQYMNADGERVLVDLSDGERALYLIKPRTAGNSNMKFEVQGKINPNLLIAAAMMLPKTCARNKANSISVSPVTTENYWLRSMWFEIEQGADNLRFIPKDYVFESGRQTVKDHATNKNITVGEPVYFQLDYQRRINDIIELSADARLPQYAVEVLEYFSNVYMGSLLFEYDEASSRIIDLIRQLSAEYWESYSGYTDPLDFLLELCDHGHDAFQAVRQTPQDIHQPRNLIYFGAPGTGKSYQLNKVGVRTKDNPGGIFPKERVRRVTFYPDYTYSQFVGSYRPFTEDGSIGYRYIPGPFLETYIDASLHPYENYLLIIEELNRANPAAVFGDVFQLLDRNAFGTSEYYVSVPEEMSARIKEALDELNKDERNDIERYFDPDMDFQEFRDSTLNYLALPPNMYIWATMNSADQGVFPMDTAFKRRWDFRYMGIDEGENATPSALGGERLDRHAVKVNGVRIIWNELRKAINTLLLDNGVNEDKLLGPFFLSPEALSDELYGDEGKSRFIAAFEDKVLLYLYEDVGKMRRGSIFQNGGATFAGICTGFERDGVGVFRQNTEKHRDIFGDVFTSVEGSDAIDQGNEE